DQQRAAVHDRVRRVGMPERVKVDRWSDTRTLGGGLEREQLVRTFPGAAVIVGEDEVAGGLARAQPAEEFPALLGEVRVVGLLVATTFAAAEPQRADIGVEVGYTQPG